MAHSRTTSKPFQKPFYIHVIASETTYKAILQEHPLPIRDHGFYLINYYLLCTEWAFRHLATIRFVTLHNLSTIWAPELHYCHFRLLFALPFVGEIQCMKKGACLSMYSSEALPQAYQKTRRDNAPDWAHHHSHAALEIVCGSISEERLVSVDAKSILGTLDFAPPHQSSAIAERK